MLGSLCYDPYTNLVHQSADSSFQTTTNRAITLVSTKHIFHFSSLVTLVVGLYK